jgi:hypothetical protein
VTDMIRFLLAYSLQAYDSVRREVLYNILIEFGVPMKLVRLIKMYSKIQWRSVTTKGREATSYV